MIPRRYLVLFSLAVAFWAGLALGVSWLVDPYGVSPIKVGLRGFNQLKPARINIDRLIKPYEVWRYRPKTVFLGTSRIQQSIDPAVLDGTRFAPAYNAAVPAATINENAAFLEQYIASDPNLKNVFFELFIYAFIGPTPEVQPKGMFDLIRDAATLQFSSSVLSDSMLTLYYNRVSAERPPFIAPRGYWVRPASWDVGMNFVAQNYSAFVIGVEKGLGHLHLADQPFLVLKHLQDICDRKGVRLTFIITPNYPWDDYRLLSLGYSNFLHEFYQRVATLREVYSFAQNVGPATEPVAGRMTFWSDPIHFSRSLGAMIQDRLAGRTDPGAPPNFSLPITPSTVDAALEIRRAALQVWLQKNPGFAPIFDTTKRLTLGGPPTGALDIKGPKLVVGDRSYWVEPGVGAVETATEDSHTLTISGWAVDLQSKGPVDTIVATSGDKVIAEWLPTTGRYDIEHGFGIETRPAGFTMKMPRAAGPIRVFAICGGVARQLASEVPAVYGEPVAALPGHLGARNLEVGASNHPLVSVAAGSLESADSIFPGYKVRGWAADVSANLPVKMLVATAGDSVVAMTRPVIERADIEQGVATKARPAGFAVDVPTVRGPIRVFAILADGAAVALASGLPAPFVATKFPAPANANESGINPVTHVESRRPI